MKSANDVVIARGLVGGLLNRLEEGGPVDPKYRAVLTGAYAMACYVLEIPNKAAEQMRKLLEGGTVGSLIPPPAAVLDVGQMKPSPEETT